MKQVFGDAVGHRTSKFKNNRLEQDHRGVKGRTPTMRGFQLPDSAHLFWRAQGEARNFLCPATRRNQQVPPPGCGRSMSGGSPPCATCSPSRNQPLQFRAASCPHARCATQPLRPPSGYSPQANRFAPTGAHDDLDALGCHSANHAACRDAKPAAPSDAANVQLSACGPLIPQGSSQTTFIGMGG
ncbi:hypothetical protein Sp245p_12160 [Azospirillum baldaniorum]|nr:hypothetical protein Sp245p_12160 [Azospirillum baldaniorum]